MANANMELTEEDAADLQFPKDYNEPSTSQKTTKIPSISTFVSQSDNNFSTIGHCAYCKVPLFSRCIYCEICKVDICLQCFANGAEFEYHLNNHDYRVINQNFFLFDNSDWTAEEELKLLESMLFYRNWKLVATKFSNRTLNEIKEHYEYFYLDKNGHPDLPGFEERENPNRYNITIPYRFRIVDSEDPPRYSINTIGSQSLAGYNAARGDFENEYDKNAEDILSSLEYIDNNGDDDDDDDDPMTEILINLQCAIFKSYNNRLRERQRRKDIIARHGLITLRRTASWLHRYDKTITKSAYDKLIRFMHLCEPVKFEMLMEGLHRVRELNINMQRLIQLRRNGITTLSEGRMFLKLQEIHETYRKQLKTFRTNPLLNWNSSKYSNANLNLLPKFLKKKNQFAPIDIIGMPGYEKLTDKEKHMCSTVRLVPATYLELKEILINENAKNGHVKLQTARRLLKIDVNKTRKLYDFLIEESYIEKPPDL